ncbi:MAG TPA: caspase family protein [Rhizobacter sp.]|nr:caspase family protein [Rhizobacter sp.]
MGAHLPLGHLAALLLCSAVLAGCGLTLPSWSTGSRKGPPPKVALVIGNAAYENVIPLRNPSNDAADMCAKLKKLGFETLCHTNVRDRAEFDSLVQKYVGQLDTDAVGVFYYSGHGVQAGLTNYLVPTRVQLRSATENPTRALYSVDELFDRLGKRRAAKLQLVILDACRTDLFAPPPAPTTRLAGGADGRPPLVRALESVAGASNGLQPIKDAPASTLVLYATASKDTAIDGDGRNGILTKHILAHIDTKGITVEQFTKRVSQGVEQETREKYNRPKTPYVYSSFSGEYCFGGCAPPPPPPPIPVPSAN